MIIEELFNQTLNFLPFSDISGILGQPLLTGSSCLLLMSSLSRPLCVGHSWIIQHCVSSSMVICTVVL